MVWGLKLPNDFGPFSPGGDFVGYREQLDAAFDGMTAEEQAYYGNSKPAYRLHVSQCFTCEHGTMHGERRVFRPVAEHEWPRELRMRHRYRKMGSLVQSVNRLLLIDRAFRDILEKLEPGVHQFRPIRLTYSKDEVYSEDYFTLIIGTFLTSFDPEQSAKGSWKNIGGAYSVIFHDAGDASLLAMRKSVFGGYHLWRERELRFPEVYFSNELLVEVGKAGLSLPKHFQMKEV